MKRPLWERLLIRLGYYNLEQEIAFRRTYPCAGCGKRIGLLPYQNGAFDDAIHKKCNARYAEQEGLS